VRLFSLVPLVWESNPKLQGGWCKPNHQPIGGSDPNHQGIWSPPRAGLFKYKNAVRAPRTRKKNKMVFVPKNHVSKSDVYPGEASRDACRRRSGHGALKARACQGYCSWRRARQHWQAGRSHKWLFRESSSHLRARERSVHCNNGETVAQAPARPGVVVDARGRWMPIATPARILDLRGALVCSNALEEVAARWLRSCSRA
jgi:hypothetical protein